MNMAAAALIAFGVGIALGFRRGTKAGTANGLWRVRMHFYAQGLTHAGVDNSTKEILQNPGYPNLEFYRRITAERAARGLKP